ncbi:MAG: hypothetical protein WCO88_13925 [Actinomycetota bacterium]|jgi:polyhydroxyalkanoate synthesis regulator phasin
MKKRIVTAGLVAGLMAGAGAGLILEQSGFAGASNVAAVASTTGSSSSTDATGSVPVGTSGATGTEQGRPDPGTHLAEVLKPLVTDGTLTQAQADKVVAALVAARPQGGQGGPGGHHGHGPDGKGGAKGLDAAAKALNMTAADLRTQLEGGSTIAKVATDKGVAVQTVIDAMVADAKAHLAQEVTDGKLTQAQADTRLTEITARITDVVNNGRPQHAAGDQPPADQPPADQATTPTTAG